MKMEWREMRDFSESLEIQKLIDVLIDVLDDAVHAIDIHLEALGRAFRHCNLRRGQPYAVFGCG